MRLFITLVFLSLGIQTASAAMCSVNEGRYWYPRLKAMPITDKAMHCTLSCHLAIRCTSFESWSFGRFKELMDVLGPGNAEWGDLAANDDGLQLAKTKRAINIRECLRECRGIYPVR